MKKAIVVGATSGIGRAVAELFAEAGYKVGITGRRRELLSELQRQRPESYISNVFDVTDTGSVVDHLEALVSELGGLDLLFLSSGTGNRNEALDFDIEIETVNTNVGGFTCIVDWTFNYFRQQQFGQLVSVSSVAGLRGLRFAPAYNASKAYQMNYLQALRQKSHHLGLPIVITDVRPGFVDTAMAKGEGVFWSAPVTKAAKQIVAAIDRKQTVVYITKRWRYVAVLLKLIPRALFERL
jgi:short-subunit dehydrogenase